MFSKKLLLIAVSAVGLSYFFMSCGEKGGSNNKQTDTTQVQNTSKVEQNVKEIVQEVPKPSEFPGYLEAAGVEYNGTILNPVSNADKYMTTSDLAAINLGIYAIDLGYTLNYEKTQEGFNYMQACKKLSDKVGVTSSIDQPTIEKFQKNLNNKDTLVAIADNTVKNMDKFLRDNERVTMSAMIIGGMFIEGLYMATQLAEQYPSGVDKKLKDEVMVNLIRLIIDQKTPLQNAIKSIEAVQKDQQGEKLLNGLRDIETVFNELKLEERIAKQSETGTLITSEDIKPLTQKTKEVRTQFVQ